jgi:L-ornithine Nalpha-acyltransferase
LRSKAELAISRILNTGGKQSGAALLRLAQKFSRAYASLNPQAPVLGRLGSLETRLARNSAEIRAAQNLRFRVFFDEMSAYPNALSRITRRDHDRWDRICDHLLLIDRQGKTETIVGTYRLLRADIAKTAAMPLYSQSEFEIAPLIARHDGLNFLELGRSCVLPEWRNKRSIELLWHGTWRYVLEHKIDVMIGCASFPVTEPEDIAEELAFLYHNAAPEPEWEVRAVPEKAVPMDRMSAQEINPRRALSHLPPLIKGYLRLGAWIGREAVIDRHFGTIDILIILPVSRLNPRYVNYYGADAGRHGTAGFHA